MKNVRKLDWWKKDSLVVVGHFSENEVANGCSSMFKWWCHVHHAHGHFQTPVFRGSSSRSYQDKNSPEQMSKKHNDSDDTHLDLESSSAVWLGACISWVVGRNQSIPLSFSNVHLLFIYTLSTLHLHMFIYPFHNFHKVDFLFARFVLSEWLATALDRPPAAV